MKTALILLLILLQIFGVNAQKIPVNPKDLKGLPTLPSLPKLIDLKTILTDLDIGSYYILENERIFWVADFSDMRLRGDACYSPSPLYRWRFKGLPDGSYQIISAQDPNIRLAWLSVNSPINPSITGIRNAPASTSRFVLIRQGESPGNAFETIHDKFWFSASAQNRLKIYYNERKDSLEIRTYSVNAVSQQFINWQFDSLNGWQTNGNAFQGQPSEINRIPFYETPVIPPMPLGGSYWREIEEDYFSYGTRTDSRYINTARPGRDRWQRPDPGRTGEMISEPFISCYDKWAVKIGGTEDIKNIRFEILVKAEPGESGALVSFNDGQYRILSELTGHNNSIVRTEVISIPQAKYRICRVRLIDQSTTGFLMIDNINLNYTAELPSERRPDDPVIPQPKPIWGAIDMHTHPMSYLGMGGKMMNGRLDGDPNVALADCKTVHGGWGTDNPGGNFIRAEIINLIDKHNHDRFRHKLEDFKVPHNDHPSAGFPALRFWPVQHSRMHQQMWFQWIDRARQGGLKAIIALTVNNEVLGRVLGGDSPYDDRTSADRQIDELIAFVRRHDFLDTVTTPQRMREVINSGRMAVIIGMEVDNIGNFYKNVPVTEEMVRNEIARLKQKGVRYIFPIHATDNAFGGAALYEGLFIFASKYDANQPLVSTVPVNAWPPMLRAGLPVAERAPDRNVTFKVSSIFNFIDRLQLRGLLEILEAGGFPMLPPPPPPADIPFITANTAAKAALDPILFALKHSQQFQLAKKIFLDPHPEANQYDTIPPEFGHRNSLGLTPIGRFFIRELMRQGMMIDIDHASEKAVEEILQIARENHYPVNSGHNTLRKPNDNEKSRTRSQLRTIAELGGLLGIGWEDMTPEDFAQSYSEHLALMGNQNTAIGSDINGYAYTPKAPRNRTNSVNYTDRTRPDFLVKCNVPATTPPRDWDYNREGMAHIGMMPDFFEAVYKAGLGKDKLHQLFMSCEYFARMWERCEQRSAELRR
ncbi:MAG: membrane dipeptidase [Chitinophagaceae bacterium]|nr:membrane dipeptidase [Chitinophagaceae bacterium]